jgi:hypothetical protein
MGKSGKVKDCGQETGRTSQRMTMNERWNLYLNLEYQAPRWPWAKKSFTTLESSDVESLPFATHDFTRYSPTDGPIDRVHVPGSLPREEPVCQTTLAVYHDSGHLYLFIAAAKPRRPVPELADCPNEDFSIVLSSGCAGRGIYFGMNQTGAAIGCTQVWDPDIPFVATNLQDHFAKTKNKEVAGPSGWRSGLLDGLYAARVLANGKGLVGCFQINRDLIAAEMDAKCVRLTAARVCYATGEWVSWGSPVLWSARDDMHGTVRLVESVQPALLPTLARVDLVYDPPTESAAIEAHWQGANPESIGRLNKTTYAGYADKLTFALNSHEVTVPLAASTRAEFALPNGWNRLEIMTAANPVKEISFQKVSGNSLHVSLKPTVSMPSLAEIRKAFDRWHEGHDQTYRGGGIWGDKVGNAEAKKRYCLCHSGIFHIEPYLVASRYLERQPTYDQRIREMCERALAERKPEGWFPCYCSGNAREPELGDGGAFTNGSVGEGLVLASDLLHEKKWLAAAERAADYSWYRWESNQNYAAFALWHLAALYERDHQKRWLDRALYLARHFVTRDIGLSGAQGGHNYFTGYGNITLKGMARLLAVLPSGHEFRPLLKDKVIRFANQILSRQQPSGLVAGRNRKYLGYHHPVPGLFFVADAIPEEAAPLEPALAAMTSAMIRGGEEDSKRKVDSDSGLVLALALKYCSAGRNKVRRQQRNRKVGASALDRRRGAKNRGRERKGR